MNKELKNDEIALEVLLETVKKQGLSYLHAIDDRPTSTEAKVTKIKQLPENGIGTMGALAEFNSRLEPLMVASSGPRYWGFVTGGTTPAAIAGDWLSTVYDQNTQSEKGHGDNSAQIELETIALLLDLLRLPQDYLGGFVTGATMSNFTALAVGRQWLGKQKGKDIAKEGMSTPLKVLSACPHSSALKSLALLGIGSQSCIPIACAEGNREAMDMADLEQKIVALQGEPFILISSGGTVNTVDFDDFESIALLRKKYEFWWHIDAAFGGFAACSEQHRHLLKGWEQADSITVDCHKWLNVPYESAVFLIKEIHRHHQVETFQNSNAPYLGDPLDNFTYLHFLPENSRRLKALPAWFSLMAYGKRGYQEIVDNNIENARQFGEFISSSAYFQLLAPVRLNTVCFHLQKESISEKEDVFLSRLNSSGKVFMTPTLYKGQRGIRAAFVNWRTTPDDLDLVTKLMDEIARQL